MANYFQQLQYDQIWEERFNELHGLGTWVYWIRKTKNNLTQEQIAQLDGVGFEWDAMVALEKRIELENKQTGKTKPLPPIRWRKEKDETKE